MEMIRSHIEQQVNEIDLLRCCYPSNDEFHLDDIEAIDQAKAFLNGQIDFIHRNLSFIIKLHLSDAQVKISTEKKNIHFRLIFLLDGYSTAICLSIALSSSTSGYSSPNVFLSRMLREIQ